MQEETISTFFEHDHEQLDELFTSYRGLKRTDPGRAKELFVRFRDGLLRHIRWEEGILFPSFEDKTGFHQSGPTQVMRSEHRQIEKQLGEIDRKLAGGGVSSDEDDQYLLNLLSFHNQKEEQILYPSIDRTLSDDGRREVFEKMKTL